MELVEGETLADHIARRPIPVDEALPIAKQIAEALEAAHEQGIIHRDLKPANIKVRPDGTVKVLDFGLAKLAESTAAQATTATNLSMSPTITSPALVRGVGVLLGTAAYMSPEQAKGKPADKRSDIWAFGCVLYEMLTGKRAFAGDDVSETLASVLAREPDWTALPATVAPAIRALLRRCLDKDRRKRIGDIAAARFAIEEAGALGTATASDVEVQPRIDAAVATVRAQLRRVMRVRMALVTAGAVLVVGATVGAAVWYATRPTPPRVVQLAIPTTPATALTINGIELDLAITPDGSRVVYVGKNGRELFVRPLDAAEPVSLFTGAPRGPFVSPDGQWVGFTDGQNILKKVPITGGPPVTIAARESTFPGATWTPDDTIVFATTDGLQQVPAAGGPTTPVTRLDRERGDAIHLWPELLPGGRAMLFTIVPAKGFIGAAQIAALDRRTGAQTVVLRGGSQGHYVASGHLLYNAANALRAVAFDPVSLSAKGTAVRFSLVC
jgi:eukaryotic-like serine/threonine-protein kinase